MSSEKNIVDLKATAQGEGVDAAVEAEREANAEPDISTYTHTFKNPVNYQGTIIEELTFDWGKLTGADYLEIENELLMRGKTLVTPEFSCDFLWRMATRACTMRDDKGVRVLRPDASNSMPIRDFQVICKRARSFLLRAGS